MTEHQDIIKIKKPPFRGHNSVNNDWNQLINNPIPNTSSLVKFQRNPFHTTEVKWSQNWYTVFILSIQVS